MSFARAYKHLCRIYGTRICERVTESFPCFICCVSRISLPLASNGASTIHVAEPEVLKKADIPPLKWTPADEEGIVKFLVEERNFNEDRVRNVVRKINNDRGKSNQGQDWSHLLVVPQSTPVTLCG